jgi:hypothetical protein
MNLVSMSVYAQACILYLLSVLLLHITSPAAEPRNIYIVKQNYEKIAREIGFISHAIK